MHSFSRISKEKVLLTRACASEKGTFGLLSQGGIPLCVTCEEPWGNNARKISCIPAGTYRCSVYSGTKFKNVWMVKDVPRRSAILIHWGNTIKDIEGCILVGSSFSMFGDLPGVSKSKITFEALRKTLGDEFDLVIRDAT